MDTSFPNIDDIKKIKDNLVNELAALKNNSEELDSAIRTISNITEWKYSRGVFYTPEQFFNELLEESPGKPLQKKYISPLEARRNGAESAGFIDDRLVLTIDSEKQEPELVRLTANLISYKDSEIFIRRTHHYDFTDKPSKKPELVSLTTIKRLSENLEVSVGIFTRGDYGFKVFSFNENNLVNHIYVLGSRHQSTIRYDLHYMDDEKVESITTKGRDGEPDITIWKNAQTNHSR